MREAVRYALVRALFVPTGAVAGVLAGVAVVELVNFLGLSV